jgi:dual-specificity kinase
MVFERLGCSLYEVIKMNKYEGFPIHFVQKIARQVIKTLEYLHEQRLVHTDLKPENICFTDTKLVQVPKGRQDG